MVLKEREVKRETPVAVKVPDVFEQGMKKKTKGYLFVGIGILVLALVTGFGFWLGSRGDGISSAEKKANEARNTALIGEEAYQKVKETGPGLADKLLKDKTVAPVAPVVVPTAGFRTGNWTETTQTKYGPLKVSYSIASVLKDAIRSKPVLEDGVLRIYLQNVLSRPVDSIAILRWKDKEGKTMGVNDPKRDFSPGEIRDIGGAVEGATSVEIKIEIN